MPTQVWLLEEILLLWLIILLAECFPQGWFLLSLSCVSSSAAMPLPGDQIQRDRLPSVPEIWLSALNSRCVSLFGGWKNLASMAFGGRIVISQGHLL